MKNVLKAWIRKNLLTEDPSDYLASVVVNGSVTMQDIVRELLTSGYNVNTGLLTSVPAELVGGPGRVMTPGSG